MALKKDTNGTHWVKANVVMTAIVISLGSWLGVRSVKFGEQMATIRATMYTLKDAQSLELALTSKITSLEITIARKEGL